jgi:hypothetical protein
MVFSERRVTLGFMSNLENLLQGHLYTKNLINYLIAIMYKGSVFYTSYKVKKSKKKSINESQLRKILNPSHFLT